MKALSRVRTVPSSDSEFFPEVDGIAGLMHYALLGLLSFFFLAFVGITWARFQFPLAFEWYEDAVINTVARVLAGQKVFVPSTLEYSPMIYAPGYYYFGAAVAWIFGLSFSALRLLSAFAFAGCLAVVAALIYRETRQRFAAFVGAGLLAGLYGLCGGQFDTARVDSLYLFWLTCATYCIRFSASRRNLLFGAAFAVLAIFTKQTGALPVAALCGWALMFRPHEGRKLALLIAGGVALSFGILDYGSQGWAHYFMFQAPASHPIDPSLIRELVFRDIFQGVGIGLVFCAVLLRGFHKRRDRSALFFYGGLLAATAIASLLPRIKVGGVTNNLMPVGMAVAIGCGLFHAGRPRKKGIEMFYLAALLALCGQLLYYNPKNLLPDEQRIGQSSDAVKVLRDLSEPLFAPFHSREAAIAGKGPSTHWGSFVDGSRWGSSHLAQEFRAAFDQAIASRRFRWVVLPTASSFSSGPLPFPTEQLEVSYRRLTREEMATHGWHAETLEIFEPRN